MTLELTSGSGTLACGNSDQVIAVNGVATFSGCTVDGTPGSYTLAATSPGLTNAIGPAIDIYGVASSLAFSSSPTGGRSGSPLDVDPTVAVEDVEGDVVSDSNTSITLQIGSGSGTLGCDSNTVPATEGVATFSNCTITGAPGSYTLEATANGLSDGISQPITLLAPELVITTTSLPSGAQGQTYGAQLEATGGYGSYTWSIAGGYLPGGVGLDPSTGEISGTPTGTGSSSVTVQVTDQSTPTAQVVTADLPISISLDALSISTGSLPNGIGGQSYDAILEASGGYGSYTWSIIDGSLPTGLSLDIDTGEISGTSSDSGTSSFTVQVTDQTTPSPQTNATDLSIEVIPPLQISTMSLPSGNQGQSYDTQLSATGGYGSYNWSISGGNLPGGLGLNPSTGEISGTPTGTGSPTFTVQVTDQSTPTSQIVTTDLSISVALNTLTITTGSLPGGTQNQGYGQTLQASGGYGSYSWSIVSGGLPAGLGLNGGNGQITGTASGSGTSYFTVQVSDQTTPTSQTSSANLSINIAPAAPSITASKGAANSGCSGCYNLNVAVHNFPTGTFTYRCYDQTGNFYTNTVTITNPNQSSWPGVFCYDSHPYDAYIVIDGYKSNTVDF